MGLHSSPPDRGVFDDLVIGSSPLMLLQASLLAREGRGVCLVERDVRMGGSWKTAVLDSGEDVEIACHLIEVFPGIYEYLENASGVPFVPLEAQPIRVHRSGLVVPYFSRVLMLASGARLLLGWLRARIDWALGRAEDQGRLINFQTKLSSYLRHQMPAFIQPPVMRGPKHGFVDFMDRLLARTRLDGVRFVTADLQSLKRVDGTWHAIGKDGQQISAEHVHCTTSTNLRPTGPGRLTSTVQNFAHRLCIVVDVPKRAVRVSQTYVAFWNDPVIARISRIDMPQDRPYLRFLAEFHDPERSAMHELHNVIHAYLVKSRIIATDGPFEIAGHVDCMFTTNVNQLPAGRIDENFWGYYSMGNLAAGLAAWRKTERLPRLSPVAADEKG
jgi:hypothetical protein